MKNSGLIYAFLGGAVVGALAAILFAPEKGSDLRKRIKEILKRRGIDFTDDDVEELVDQISAQVEGIVPLKARTQKKPHLKAPVIIAGAC